MESLIDPTTTVYSGTPGGSTRLTAREDGPWRRLLDVLFPARCLGCGVRGEWLCPECIERAPRAPVAVTRPGLAIDGLAAEYVFEGTVRDAVHRLKYSRSRHLASTLTPLLAHSFDDLREAVPRMPDLIVPVPLHPRRRAQRGYNQSELLATHLGAMVGLSVAPQALARLRDTRAQTRLPAAQRRANVQGAFAAEAAIVSGKRVLLVDDVTTTGATMLECVAALRAAGAISVCGATIARAI